MKINGVLYSLFFVFLSLSLFFVSEFSYAGNILHYGNYGWINYSSGRKATNYFPNDFSASAVDSMDVLFKKHDQVYWAAEEMGGKTGKRFICEGDIELLNGLNHLKRIGIKNWVSKPKDTPHAIMYLNAAIKFFKNKYLLKCRR